MKKFTVLFLLLILVAWWQKDTLDDRAQTNTSSMAPWIQQVVAQWSKWTPSSPAKEWTHRRDALLDRWFSESLPIASTSPLAVIPNPVMDSTQEDNTAVLDVESPAITPPRTILIAGDSMSGDVGLSLRQIAYHHKKETGQDIHIIDAHRHSTGLVVPSYYNWPVELRLALTKHNPDAVVFMVGANDGQAMRLADKSWVRPGTLEWHTEYARRAAEIFDVTNKTTLVWLDLPSMRSPDLQQRTAQVNPAIEQSLKNCKPCVYIKTRDFFGGDTYNESMRSKDGVHYNRSGANHVAGEIWKSLGLPLTSK